MITRLFTVNSIGAPEPIIVQTVCKRIKVGEDPSQAGYPTTDFQVFKPTSTSGPRQIAVGGVYDDLTRDDPRLWQPGDTAGYVATITGSIQMFQDEQ